MRAHTAWRTATKWRSPAGVFGVALVRAGRLAEGREEFLLAVAADPDDDAKSDLEASLGPATKQQRAWAAATVRAWRQDAGVAE
jgi:hypothetical protein